MEEGRKKGLSEVWKRLGRKGGLGQKCRVGLMKVREARREWPGRVGKG